MNKFDEYQQLALRTVTTKTYLNRDESLLAMAIIGMSNEWGEFLELISPHVLYNMPLPRTPYLEDEMGDILWYISVASSMLHLTLESVMKMQTENILAKMLKNKFYTKEALIVETTMTSIKIGKAQGPVKKHLWHGHDLPDQTEALHEIGFHLTATAVLLGVDITSVLDKNIEKLKKRYPDGFSIERSVNREKQQ